MSRERSTRPARPFRAGRVPTFELFEQLGDLGDLGDDYEPREVLTDFAQKEGEHEAALLHQEDRRDIPDPDRLIGTCAPKPHKILRKPKPAKPAKPAKVSPIVATSAPEPARAEAA